MSISIPVTFSCLLMLAVGSRAAVTPFSAPTTEWHGFTRYDFVMDEQTFAITPFTRPADEGAGVHDPQPGQRRCIVVVPAKAAPGNPWSWQGCYWDHQPQAEIELLRRGFHIAYISANATLKPDKTWDAWHTWLTEQHGLSKKPAFVGMSRGGEYEYTWAVRHPDEVSCIYADNPGGNSEMLEKLDGLARNDVPLLHVCGSIDPLLGRFSGAIESMYQQYGGRISVMVKEGYGHHPHSLRDPSVIADFIVESQAPRGDPAPGFMGPKALHMSFYSVENSYRYFPRENAYISCRGPIFTNCYDRFDFPVDHVEGTVTDIAPTKEAPGKPWVYRAGFVSRDARIDLGLLARGYHIVVGPVPYNADGPKLSNWNTVYALLVAHGYSAKPTMEGSGGGAGEVYAWAIENPDKVSCIYAENPVLRAHISQKKILDSLEPLAKANILVVNLCGASDPNVADNSQALEQRYKSLGGKITLFIQKDAGHYLSDSKDAPAILDLLTQ